jgi:hypothetical protein
MQRLAVLTTALGQTPPDPELTYEAMKDRVHQPYRKPLVRIVFGLKRTAASTHFFFALDTWSLRNNFKYHAFKPSRSSWNLLVGRWPHNSGSCNWRV